MAGTLYAAWIGPDGFAVAVYTASQGNEHYPDAREAVRDLLRSLVGAVEGAIALKLGRPLGGDEEVVHPRRAESWRSARSIPNLIANLETAQALLETPGVSAMRCVRHGAEAVAVDIAERLNRILDELRQIERPLQQAVEQEAGHKQLTRARDELQALRSTLLRPLPEALGIAIGFNAFDGD